MSIEISAPVAGTAGGIALAGGGVLAASGARRLNAAVSIDRLPLFVDGPAQVNEIRAGLDDLSGTLRHLNDTADVVRHLPGQKAMERLPFVGGIAGRVNDAVAVGAGALDVGLRGDRLGELARGLDDTLVATNKVLGNTAHALEHVRAMRAPVLGGGARLAVGAGLAVAGVGLLAASVFDVG